MSDHSGAVNVANMSWPTYLMEEWIFWFVKEDLVEILLFTMGYVLQAIGTAILIFRVLQIRSSSSLNLDSQFCFTIASLSRCIWIHHSRVTESYFATFEAYVTAVMSCVLLHLCYKYADRTVHGQVHRPTFLRVYVLVPAAMALAYMAVYDGGFEEDFYLDSVEVLALFFQLLEAMALLPQLQLLRTLDEVDGVTSHYVGLIVLARLTRVAFWVALLNLEEAQNVVLWFFVADVLHTLFALDYFVLWIQKLKTGGKMVYNGEALQNLVNQNLEKIEFIL